MTIAAFCHCGVSMIPVDERCSRLRLVTVTSRLCVYSTIRLEGLYIYKSDTRECSSLLICCLYWESTNTMTEAILQPPQAQPQPQPVSQPKTSTLKSFQLEMEHISHVKHAEAIKQAKEAHAAAELARHHGKKKEKEKEVIKEVKENEHLHDEVEEVPELPIEVCQAITSNHADANLIQVVECEADIK